MKYKILQGDNRETLKTIPNNSIDAIITDPPYGIDFLGKAWDANTGALETYQECLRVLKPGGHILAFSAARTYHHLAITLEQAGFEIRDQIMWIYSSGFPKSQDIGKSIDRSAGKKNNLKRHDSPNKDNNGLDVGSGVKCPKCHKDSAARYDCKENDCGMIYKAQTPEAEQWLGWGTSLKPAHEPIALARKPISEKNIAQNCQKYGTGALNIDATRVPYADKNDIPVPHGGKARAHKDNQGWINTQTGYKPVENPEINPIGRFTSNVIGEIADDYQKYFYCPKVSRKERHIGYNTTDIPTNPNGMWDDGVQFQNQQAFSGNTEKGNNHPTVKPVELMKYLIKLITPPGGVVLDPFNGSGSTGMAAVELGHEYIGCELDPAYVDIATKRIEAYWELVKPNNTFDKLFGEA
jgi:site-specific DNA-methyltransferase (adenine-specific)